MYDKSLILDILKQIKNSLEIILKRFSAIKKPDDFTNSNEGLEKLDSICMQLIAIGESLKQIDKISGKELLKKYSEIEWDKAKRIRDVIAHHYFDVDEEVVFTVCKVHLPLMHKVVEKIIKDLEG